MKDNLLEAEKYVIVRLYAKLLEFQQEINIEHIDEWLINQEMVTIGIRQDKILEEAKNQFTRSEILKAIYLLDSKLLLHSSYVGRTKFIKLTVNGFNMFEVIKTNQGGVKGNA